MTRSEEIEQAFSNYPDTMFQATSDLKVFTSGAEWADLHPGEELVNKLCYKFSMDNAKQYAHNLIEIELLKKTILNLREALTNSQETLNYIANWEENASIYYPDDDEGYYYRFILHKLSQIAAKSFFLIAEKSK